MSGRTLAEVLLRCWGVVLIVTSAGALASIPWAVTPSGFTAGPYSASQIGPTLGALLVKAGAGAALVWGGGRLASAMRTEETSDHGTWVGASDLVMAAVIILGIYFLLLGVVDLIVSGMTATSPAVFAGASSGILMVVKYRAIGGVVQLAVGLALLLTRHTLAGLAPSRRLGMSEEDD